MAYKRKYKKGEMITSIDEFAKQEFVYFKFWGDKPKHISFMKSMPFRVIENLISVGLYKAIPVESEEV